MKVQEIRELIRLIDQSNIDEFLYESGDIKLVMKKRSAHPHPVPAPPERTAVAQGSPERESSAPETPRVPVPDAGEPEKIPPVTPQPARREPTENYHQIVSPMVGTFYQAPSPGAEPYVTIGSRVKEDTVVCIIEAMKLFNEIEADVRGEIVDILVKDGQLVEYGQPLFLVKPE